MVDRVSAVCTSLDEPKRRIYACAEVDPRIVLLADEQALPPVSHIRSGKQKVAPEFPLNVEVPLMSLRIHEAPGDCRDARTRVEPRLNCIELTGRIRLTAACSDDDGSPDRIRARRACIVQNVGK